MLREEVKEPISVQAKRDTLAVSKTPVENISASPKRLSSKVIQLLKSNQRSSMNASIKRKILRGNQMSRPITEFIYLDGHIRSSYTPLANDHKFLESLTRSSLSR